MFGRQLSLAFAVLAMTAVGNFAWSQENDAKKVSCPGCQSGPCCQSAGCCQAVKNVTDDSKQGADTNLAAVQGRGRGGRGMGGRGQGFGPGRGRGPDAQFVEDRDTFHFLLANHEKIRRDVKMLDNGVETLTESDDPQVAEMIRKHVAGMYRRVDEVSPIRMHDPLFVAVFQNAKAIQMKMEPTEKGVRVWETSDNPYAAKLIQAHAKVVSLFVDLGFDEAHRNHEVPKR
jgi:hypothetical protein